MKRTVFAILGLSALLACAPSIGAGEEKPYTLKQAVEAALKGNPEVRAFEGTVGAASEDIGIARSRLLPKITFEERFMRTDNPTLAFSSKLNQGRFTSQDFAIASLNTPDPINDYQTSISFEQPLYVRMAHVGLDMAKTEYSATVEDFSRKKEEVAFNTVKTYLMAVSAQGFVNASKKAVEDSREHLRLAEARYKADLGLYSDVLRASTSVTAAEQALISAEKNLKVAKRALALLMGFEGSIEPAPEVPEFKVKDQNYYTSASSARNDLRAFETRYDNARKNIDLAGSDYFPMLGIGGSYQMNDHESPFGSEGDSWHVSAFLRWNIFDGSLRSHESKKARHKALEAANRLDGFKKAVSFRVYEAWLAIDETRKNAELAEAALKTAAEGERLVRIRFENSLSPIVDLLDAQASLDAARANAVLRKNEYLTAVANLSYESGTIFTDLGLE